VLIVPSAELMSSSESRPEFEPEVIVVSSITPSARRWFDALPQLPAYAIVA
jgi:hypothetical protein